MQIYSTLAAYADHPNAFEHFHFHSQAWVFQTTIDVKPLQHQIFLIVKVYSSSIYWPVSSSSTTNHYVQSATATYFLEFRWPRVLVNYYLFDYQELHYYQHLSLFVRNHQFTTQIFPSSVMICFCLERAPIPTAAGVGNPIEVLQYYSIPMTCLSFFSFLGVYQKSWPSQNCFAISLEARCRGLDMLHHRESYLWIDLLGLLEYGSSNDYCCYRWR